jgi:hypothetical protein
MKLVDSAEEHNLLELLLESSKPKKPEYLEDYHYLLSTPFRYPTRKGGSRFRAATDPGAFYGAYTIRTACAELGYWRLRFLLDTEDLESLDPIAHTAFSVQVAADIVDLREEPFCEYEYIWMDADDYSNTQKLAFLVRSVDLDGILYRSVRDRPEGICVAVFDPKAFRSLAPNSNTQTWHLSVNRNKVFWRRSSTEAFSFDAEDLNC